MGRDVETEPSVGIALDQGPGTNIPRNHARAWPMLLAHSDFVLPRDRPVIDDDDKKVAVGVDTGQYFEIRRQAIVPAYGG